VVQVLVNEAKVAEYGPGACFGELALIYNAKRAASISATSACTLWSLDLRTFRRMLATASSSQTMARIEFLRRVPLLQNLSNEQISKLAGALTSQTFADGAPIIRQGDVGE
jgi:CRP-like cAMP-binding protein